MNNEKSELSNTRMGEIAIEVCKSTLAQDVGKRIENLSSEMKGKVSPEELGEFAKQLCQILISENAREDISEAGMGEIALTLIKNKAKKGVSRYVESASEEISKDNLEDFALIILQDLVK